MKPDIKNKIIKKNTQLIDNVKNKIKYLRHHKHYYVYTISGSSHKLENDLMKESFNTNKLSNDDLNFIGLVRKDILSSQKILDLGTVNVRASDITYFYVNKSCRGHLIDGVFEIDIDRAYWDSAYILGYIKKETWELGCLKNKVLRLMSLGSFAKKKYTFIYDPNAKNELDREKIYPQSNPYQYVWYNISKYVSDCMVEIKNYAKDYLIFFWVDAVFVKNEPEIIDGIYQIIYNYGFNHKKNSIKSIDYNINGEILVSDDKHDDGRLFNTPKNKISALKLISELNYETDQIINIE